MEGKRKTADLACTPTAPSLIFQSDIAQLLPGEALIRPMEQ